MVLWVVGVGKKVAHPNKSRSPSLHSGTDALLGVFQTIRQASTTFTSGGGCSKLQAATHHHSSPSTGAIASWLTKQSGTLVMRNPILKRLTQKSPLQTIVYIFQQSFCLKWLRAASSARIPVMQLAAIVWHLDNVGSCVLFFSRVVFALCCELLLL